MSAIWTSNRHIRSALRPEVEFQVARMSFGRRLELMKNIRELAARIEFCEAGQTEGSRMEASLLAGQMDRLFLEWGVQSVTGLEIDGEAATVAALIDRGPEELVHEVLGIVKTECGLSESERKN
jgi:hypothetical protein